MLCGLQRPVKNYDPSNYENELYLITKKSKGYRAGFEDEYEPILGDENYTPIIKERILEIVQTLRERGLITDIELGITPVKEKTFQEKIVERALLNALTGTDDTGDKQLLKSNVGDLTARLDKLQEDYDKLDNEHKKLVKEHQETIIKHQEDIRLKDIFNYGLLHLVQYCDAEIWGSELDDYIIFLRKMDNDARTIFAFMYQDLNPEEWNSLMERIKGISEVIIFKVTYTELKKLETGRTYNKNNIMTNLTLFRSLNFPKDKPKLDNQTC